MICKLARPFVVAWLAVAALALAASAQPVTISFWHFYGGGTAEGDLIQWAVDEFNRRHQGEIIVEPTIVGFWEMHDKYPIAMAAGIGPDVVLWNLDYVQSSAKNGLLTDLTPLIERDGIDLSDYFPAAVEVSTYQGRVYAIPFNPDTRPFYTNRALLAEAGIDPDTPPVTWADLKEYARKLTRTDAAGSYEQLGFHPMWGDSWFVPWLHSNSGRWFDENGDPIIDNPRNVEALEFVVSFIEEYGVDRLDEFNLSYDGNNAFHASQNLAMVLHTSGYMDRLNREFPDLDYNVSLIPYNTEPVSWMAGFGVEMPQGKHTEAAWEFAKFLTGYEFMEKWARETGNMGGLMSVARDVFAYDPKKAVIAEQMYYSRFNDATTHPDQPGWNIIIDQIFAATGLSKPPKSALEEAQRQISSILAEIRSR